MWIPLGRRSRPSQNIQHTDSSSSTTTTLSTTVRYSVCRKFRFLSRSGGPTNQKREQNKNRKWFNSTVVPSESERNRNRIPIWKRNRKIRAQVEIEK